VLLLPGDSVLRLCRDKEMPGGLDASPPPRDAGESKAQPVFSFFCLVFSFLTYQCQPLPASPHTSSTSATSSLSWGWAANEDSGLGHRRGQPGGQQCTSPYPTPKISAEEGGNDNPTHLHPGTRSIRRTAGPWRRPETPAPAPRPPSTAALLWLPWGWG